MAISSKHPVTKEICDALGLKRVINLHLIMKLGEIVKIEAEYYPDKKDMEKLVPILKKYELREIR